MVTQILIEDLVICSLIPAKTSVTAHYQISYRRATPQEEQALSKVSGQGKGSAGHTRGKEKGVCAIGHVLPDQVNRLQ